MRKRIIISLVCLLSILGIITYCFVNSKTDVSEQVSEVSKQEVKTVNKTTKSEEKKDADGNKTATVSKQTSTKAENSKASSTSKDKTSSQNKTNTTSQATSNESQKKVSENTSTNQSNTSVSKQEVVKEVEVQEAIQEPIIESTPVPIEPSYACPGGVDQNQACDVILDSNSYYATFSSEGEANSSGEYYLNDVMYIDETEITNFSVQPVYRNDHSIAYYGLNLWSNGSLIN